MSSLQKDGMGHPLVSSYWPHATWNLFQGKYNQWAWILAVQLTKIYRDDMLPWVLSINAYSKLWSHYSCNATTIFGAIVITKQLWLQSQLTVLTDPQRLKSQHTYEAAMDTKKFFYAQWYNFFSNYSASYN